jgi:hypothetical protein
MDHYSAPLTAMILTEFIQVLLQDMQKCAFRGFVLTLAAALIAAAILIVVDDHYNDGRYTQVLQQAVTSLLPG